MSKYYVSALARYAIVDADNEEHARELGLAALREMYVADGTKAKLVQVREVRLATEDEIEFEREHQRMTADYLGGKRNRD